MLHRYMKGRLTYEQLNTAVRKVNEAVSGKYKITRQSTKSLNNNTRKLYQRFKDEETKDTKGKLGTMALLALNGLNNSVSFQMSVII